MKLKQDKEASSDEEYDLNTLEGQLKTATSEDLDIPLKKRSRIPEGFRSLRNPNYRYFWLGAFVSNIGNWMQTMAQGWLVLALTNSPFLLGVVSFAANMPVLFFALFGGVLADRVDRRRILLTCQTIMMVLIGIMSFLTLKNIINVWEVIILSALIGVASAFSQPAFQAVVPDMIAKTDLPNAIALNSSQFNLARLIGPVITSLLIGIIGIAGAFFLNALSYLAVIAALLVITIPPRKTKQASGTVWRNVGEGFSYVRGNKLVLTIIALGGSFSILGFPYITLMPVIVRDYLHKDVSMLGYCLTAVGLGALVASLAAAQLKGVKGRGNYLIGGMGFFSIALIGFAQSQVFWLSLLFLPVLGFAMISFMTAANTLLQEIIPDQMRGRVMSLWTLSVMGFSPIGNLLSGAAAEQWGAPIALTIGGIILLGLTFLAGYYAKKPSFQLNIYLPLDEEVRIPNLSASLTRRAIHSQENQFKLEQAEPQSLGAD